MAHKIIIVDDPSMSATFCSTLKQAGYEVTCVPDGHTGLEKIKAEKPQLVLLGQVLVDMKGNDVLKTLKSDETTKDIPVAILSNFGQKELIEEALAHGAHDYILKYQVEPNDLVNKVKSILPAA